MNYVTLKELAAEFNLDRSNTRKYALNAGFKPIKVRTRESRGQLTLALTLDDAIALRKLRNEQGFITDKPTIPLDNGLGFFYVIQLVPELDPNRVKLGFSSSPERRLQEHKTAAPTASIVKVWPCKRVWEPAVIDCVTRIECERLTRQCEVYTCLDLPSLIERADAIFSLLPSVDIALS